MTTYLSSDEIKAEELKLLLEIDALCRQEGLRYSLAGGTLLGAVRHHGFIPWDDDIDISMPRPDFDQFLMLCSNADILPGNRTVEPYSGSLSYPVFLKYVNETIVVDPRYESGAGRLWVDITPVDGLPEEIAEVEEIYREARRLKREVAWGKADKDEGKTLPRRLIKRVVVPVAKSLGVPPHAAERLDKLARTVSFGDTPYVGCVTWGVYGASERYPLQGWDSLTALQFEGHSFPSISCWDSYLTGLYGDYMQLPPEDERVTHEMRAWHV